MQIPTTAANALPGYALSTPTSGNGQGTDRAGLRPTAGLPVAGTTAETSSAALDSGDVVALSTEGAAAQGSATPDTAPEYAQIWRDGQKIAVIDVHGGVTGLNGFVPPINGGIMGGATLAAQRAAQIARTFGGEIRVGGSVVDGATLNMRVRLNQAYGV